MGDLTKNFSRNEFSCRCGCGLDNISPALVDNLQHARDSLGISFVIKSGCRCKQHNEDEGGALNSSHLPQMSGFCEAADIKCLDDHTRYIMLQDFVRRFHRIGIGRTFIHVDVSKFKTEGIVWLY